MGYWWVNHKQTFNHEFKGNFIWSPLMDKNGKRNQAYENLPRTNIGDIVFSYAKNIKAIGIVSGECKKKNKPKLGESKIAKGWDNEGYLVPVNWKKLEREIILKNIINEFRHLLPNKYSPINKLDNGNQKIYLAELSYKCGDKIKEIIARNNNDKSIEIIDDEKINLEEKKIENKIQDDKEIQETVRKQLVDARIGQGKFKENVKEVEDKCRITKVDDERFLIASHIKPWRISNHEERLDGNNGLLLSPSYDKLFDKGYIGFKSNGDLLISEKLNKEIINKWSIKKMNVGLFNNRQRKYLEYHRVNIYKN
tara:strand:+ start:1322 stop:2251 length:930 start_codon:yes stop_codon:yes gene_type:complete